MDYAWKKLKKSLSFYKIIISMMLFVSAVVFSYDVLAKTVDESVGTF